MKGKYFLKQAEKQLSENESEDYISSSESESESLTTKVDSENDYDFKEDSFDNIIEFFLNTKELTLDEIRCLFRIQYNLYNK